MKPFSDFPCFDTHSYYTIFFRKAIHFIPSVNKLNCEYFNHSLGVLIMYFENFRKAKFHTNQKAKIYRLIFSL